MNRRNILIAAIGAALLAAVLLAISLVRDAKMTPAQVEVHEFIATPQYPAIADHSKEDYSAIAKQDLFDVRRGVVPKPAPVPAPAKKEPEKKEKPATLSDSASAKTTFKMLGGYPNDWPRLKLTGVFLLDGKLGAIIAGGDARPHTSGTTYSNVYREGDAIGGGVILGKVYPTSVILAKGGNGWTIYIGADPPAVPKK